MHSDLKPFQFEPGNPVEMEMEMEGNSITKRKRRSFDEVDVIVLRMLKASRLNPSSPAFDEVIELQGKSHNLSLPQIRRSVARLKKKGQLPKQESAVFKGLTDPKETVEIIQTSKKKRVVKIFHEGEDPVSDPIPDDKLSFLDDGFVFLAFVDKQLTDNSKDPSEPRNSLKLSICRSGDHRIKATTTIKGMNDSALNKLLNLCKVDDVSERNPLMAVLLPCDPKLLKEWASVFTKKQVPLSSSSASKPWVEAAT